MAGHTKYEIRLSDQDRWFVEKVFQDQKMAERLYTDYAEDDNSEYDGVQLVRVWTRADKMEVEKVVKEQRLTRRNIPVRLANIDEAAPCAHRDDYLGLNARITMSRLLRNLFDREGTIASELLYNHDKAKRFMAGDLVSPAIDRVSTLQARDSGLDSRKRRDDIFAEIQAIMDDVEKICKTKAYKSFESKELNKVVETANAIGKPMALPVVMCKVLVQYRSVEAKLQQVLAWLESDQGEELEYELDGLIAEIMSSATLIQDMLGPQRNLACALSTLLDWVEGKSVKGTGACAEAVEAFCRLFSQDRLMQTRDILFDFIIRQLAGKQPLSRNDTALEEKEFLRLFSRLTLPCGMTGGADMAEALSRRYGRSLKQGGESGERMSIKWLVEMLPDGARCLPYLIALRDAPLGNAHPDVVKQSISQLCNTARTIGDFCADDLSAKEKLVCLKDLHVLVEESTLDESEQKAVLSTLDRLVEKYLMDTKLIDKLDNPQAALHDRAIRMVQFCGSGVLWEHGHAMALARKRVVDHLKGKSFIEKFTEGENAPAQKEIMIRDFYRMMAEAGFKS
ncbi:hypothetical protein GCM10011332_18800 [Terasakiella brassicae]|uniref:Uncharacterized protein n=1 Tax=Terasakiella brassicae TaxID=1634917 RepID=A0A917FAJ4_9PROT|nr:hypothetical protein [Terasakiella brassicae]GGF64947.1 hypothetical protein GCM10011332_18800 [Terasakiella brassicae]